MKKMDEATYAKWNKSDPGPKAAVTRYWGKYGPMFVDALKELGGEIDYAKMKEFVAKHGEKYGVASHSADTSPSLSQLATDSFNFTLRNSSCFRSKAKANCSSARQ